MGSFIIIILLLVTQMASMPLHVPIHIQKSYVQKNWKTIFPEAVYFLNDLRLTIERKPSNTLSQIISFFFQMKFRKRTICFFLDVL